MGEARQVVTAQAQKGYVAIQNQSFNFKRFKPHGKILHSGFRGDGLPFWLSSSGLRAMGRASLDRAVKSLPKATETRIFRTRKSNARHCS